MKTLKLLLSSALLIYLTSCGNNKTEEEKQKRIEDSIMEIERNGAIGNAENFLKNNDPDSISPKDTSSKKK